MLVKIYKKALLVLAVVMLLSSIALPEPAASPLVGTQEEPPPESVSASPLVTGQVKASEFTQAIPGGIEVTYTGLWKHNEILEAYYTIVSNRTRRVAIEAANSQLVDANEVNIPPNRTVGRNDWGFKNFGEIEVLEGEWVENQKEVEAGAYINDEKQDILEFTANQPYNVMVRYWVPVPYILTPTFQSVTVIVNGLPATFEDVTAFP